MSLCRAPPQWADKHDFPCARTAATLHEQVLLRLAFRWVSFGCDWRDAGESELIELEDDSTKLSPFPLVQCRNIYVLPGVPTLLQTKWRTLKVLLSWVLGSYFRGVQDYHASMHI